MRKNMNPKSKKFKKFNHSHSSHFKPKSSSRKFNGKFCYVCWWTNHLASQCFQQKKEPFKSAAKENGENFEHKVNMVEQNTNKFRLVIVIPLVNSVTFSLYWWLDSRANIYICTDHSWLKSY